MRFKGEGTFFAKVTQRLTEHLQFYLSSNLVWRSQVDTYKREIERYGSENIENSEMLFILIQRLQLTFCRYWKAMKVMTFWQFALKGVDDLLDCFGFGKQEKIEFAALLSHSFKKEFNVDNPESRKLLGSKYREVRSKVNLALQDELPAEHEYHEVWKIFNDRKKKLAPCVDHINLLEITNKLSVPKADLLASYIHMFLNRFFRSKQRLQEMIIYDLLHQHYKSQLGREKQVTKITQIEPVS
ncbi:MAG: thiopeptide-type bacteriocin biosynthesis protein [Flammeovirgaceae bacterium]|nr:thiopeptide-type bacteriocin biosynthesis protein [Flammeovirgaceae bacterium]